MLWTIAFLFLIFWLIGIYNYPLGGFVHLLLVAALVAVVARFMRGNKAY